MVNAPAQLLQTHLSFHAIQVTDIRPVRPMRFAEAVPEIASLLKAQKRPRAADLTELGTGPARPVPCGMNKLRGSGFDRSFEKDRYE
jgi:hypothetical protein